MEPVFSDYLRGFALLFWLNLKHYSLAVWGLRLRLDPDYPGETRFEADLIVDAVLEYRLYPAFAPWCGLLAFILPLWASGILAALWALSARKRAYFYSSPFRFWQRAYTESPGKSRNKTRYVEELIREMERREKIGLDIDELATEARRIMDEVTN